LYIKITKLKRKSKYAHENFTHHRTFSYKRDPWQHGVVIGGSADFVEHFCRNQAQFLAAIDGLEKSTKPKTNHDPHRPIAWRTTWLPRHLVRCSSFSQIQGVAVHKMHWLPFRLWPLKSPCQRIIPPKAKLSPTAKG